MLKRFWRNDSETMILTYSDEGLPIELDENNSLIMYKDTSVSFYIIKKAFESDLDRVQLTNTLELTKKNGFVTLGCLTLTENKVKQLIKLVWKQLKSYNKVGK